MTTILNVSRRGVVTLPAKLRQALGIKGDDQIIAEATPEGLLLRPAVTLPIEIYDDKRIREFDDAEAELEKVWHDYHVAALPGPKHTVTHSTFEILIDPKGDERAIYDSTITSTELAGDLAKLTA